MGFLNYAWAVIVVCAVVFAAYYVTRAMAKAGGSLRKGANIKIAGSMPLGRDKSVALVEIGEYVYVLGVSAQRVERLDRLPKGELNLGSEERLPGSDLAESFRKVLASKLGGPGEKEMSDGRRWSFEITRKSK